MTQAGLLHDAEAEGEVAGAVLETRFGFRRVAGLVSPGDFFDPALGRVLAVAPMLDDLGPFVGLPVQSANVRVAAASVLADISLDRLMALVPAYRNASRFAVRVRAAARRRRAMASIATAYNRLLDGDDIDAVRPLLVEASAA